MERKSERLPPAPHLDAYILFGRGSSGGETRRERSHRAVGVSVSLSCVLPGSGLFFCVDVNCNASACTKSVDGKLFLSAAMSETLDRSTKINLIREPVVRRLCEVLDRSSSRGWRKLGDIVGSDRRFKVRYAGIKTHRMPQS